MVANAITLALAGFRQEDLDIQLEGTRLTVKGTPEKQETETKWLHQGLVNQPFSLSFTLADHMEVSGATFTKRPDRSNMTHGNEDQDASLPFLLFNDGRVQWL